MNLGSWKIDDVLTWTVQTQLVSGVATDADSAPGYRIYEDETTAPILTGSMALIDAANTDGFYSEQITLSVANGFEQGKSYTIRIAATVGGIAGATTRQFQVGGYAALVDSGEAVAVTNDTITLKAGFKGRCKGMTVLVNSAAEGYENRIIKSFDNATNIATFDTPLDATPGSPTFYAVLAFGAIPIDDYADDAEVGTIETGLANLQSSVDAMQDRVLERATPEDIQSALEIALNAIARPMPGAETPPETASLVYMVTMLYKALINPKEQTASQWSLLKNDGSAVEQKQTVSDNTVTATRSKISTGP